MIKIARSHLGIVGLLLAGLAFLLVLPASIDAQAEVDQDMQTRPDLLVLGRPQEDVDEGGLPAFESDAIVQFADDITEKTGVRVELA